MVHIFDLFTSDEFGGSFTRGLIKSRTNEDVDLVIYNYTNKALYNKDKWNTATDNCRGLIADNNGNIVARPFRKFWSMTETGVTKKQLVNPPSVVQEKLDGMLGVVYPHKGKHRVATRGSFDSPPAIWASKWLEEQGVRCPSGITTICEIIYPGSRILVDYGDRSELVLLGAIDVESGADIPLWEIDWWPTTSAQRWYGIKSLEELAATTESAQLENQEGLVATWYNHEAPSDRLKFKRFDYYELARIVSHLDDINLLESLQFGSHEEIIARLPDGYRNWAYDTIESFHKRFAYLETQARAFFATIDTSKDRATLSRQINEQKNAHLIYCLLDKQEERLANDIWKLIRAEVREARKRESTADRAARLRDTYGIGAG